MKKIAFFVEGPTECYFVRKLLQKYTSKRSLIRTFEGSGGKKKARCFMLNYSDAQAGQDYLIHIYISSTDNRVNSDVRENLDSLHSSGFAAVIALKDLRGDKAPGVPKTLADLPAMEHADQIVLRHPHLPVDSVIAVMEIETWFLAETNHYQVIDAGLDRALIEANVGSFEANPYTDDLTQVTQPAEMLSQIYHLKGKAYNKTESTRQRTIDALDFGNFYLNVSARLVKVQDFFNILDRVF